MHLARMEKLEVAVWESLQIAKAKREACMFPSIFVREVHDGTVRICMIEAFGKCVNVTWRCNAYSTSLLNRSMKRLGKTVS
jgi:hypothetical protein